MNKTIPTTILKQIGSPALYMIGAKNFVADEKMVCFKIMRNSKRVNHVRITLDPSDTYTVEFLNLGADRYETINKLSGVYDDMLHDVIENNTGLYLHL